MARGLMFMSLGVAWALGVCPPSATRAAQPIDVWLDVDTSTGISDVDDGLMLIQCFHSPELRIHGISVVYGNASLDQAVPIARNLTERFGPVALQVHAGAAGADELGQDNAAVRALADALRERRLTILAVGPVTNVASLIQRHPELQSRIDHVVIVAGRRRGQRFVVSSEQQQPFRDFNFENDPQAMQVLLDSDVSLVFAPWEISSQVWIDRDDLERLRTSSPAGEWIADSSEYWIAFWEREITDQGFNPFDTLAAGWLTHRRLIESLPVHVWIEQDVDDRATPEEQGAGATKPYLLVDRVAPSGHASRKAIYCFRPLPEFKAVLLERLTGRP